jgi:DNA-binding XRE family transcriptional regulator
MNGETEEAILAKNRKGDSVTRIARTVGVSRKTVYAVLEKNGVLPYREQQAIASAFKLAAELWTKKR